MNKRNLSEFFKDKQVIFMAVMIIISIVSISTMGIQQGLDLQGGALIQLQLEKPVDDATMEVITAVLDKRLNLFGVKDVKVRSSGDQIVMIEMASVDPPGIFEARIGNKTAEVALSGVDIVEVQPYEITGTEYKVPFIISIEGAKKFAEKARGKADQKVYMFLDGELIDNDPPKLSAELANGQPSTEVVVTGGENSPEEAEIKAKEIYTVLKTGSLPVKIHVVGSSKVSPELGQQFLEGAIIAGLLAVVAISALIYIRYRKPILVIPIMITSISEVIIVMGVASLIHQNMDLAAIAGLIVVIGTGVDDQIIITDEVISSKKETSSKRRRTRTRLSVKNALFIIFASAGTLIAAMLPLAYVGFARGSSGIGTLAGFAFVTIIGILIGVFITRPVYAKFMEIFLK